MEIARLATFEVLTAWTEKITVFRDLTPCLWWVVTDMSEESASPVIIIKE